MQREVLREHGLADAVGADEDDVGGVAEEVELEELLDVALVDALRVLPVEFGEGLDRRELRVAEAALVVPALALDLPDLDEPLQPGLGRVGVPVREHAVQPESSGAAAEWILSRRPHGGPRRCG